MEHSVELAPNKEVRKLSMSARSICSVGSNHRLQGLIAGEEFYYPGKESGTVGEKRTSRVYYVTPPTVEILGDRSVNCFCHRKKYRSLFSSKNNSALPLLISVPLVMSLLRWVSSLLLYYYFPG